MSFTPATKPPKEGGSGMEAELPRPVKRTNKVVNLQEWSKTPNSIRLGLYLMAFEEIEDLRSEISVSIDQLQSRLSEEEILKGYRFFDLLSKDTEVLRRTRPLLRRALSEMNRDRPILKETRRIGIGYRDKGSLRPVHKPRPEGSISCWNEDILFLLPFDPEFEARMITLEEVRSAVGYDILELLSPRKISLVEQMILASKKFTPQEPD